MAEPFRFGELFRPEWDGLPMVGVPYRLAVEFAAAGGCRLPSEEELEWAARGPSGRLAPEGAPKDWNPENLPEWNVVHAVRSVPSIALTSPAAARSSDSSVTRRK